LNTKCKPNIFSTSGILVTNFQSPFLSFYSNDFEFFPVALGQELVLVSFLDFSFFKERVSWIFLRIFFLHCKEDGVSVEKKQKEK
jgi:hypothetical protein